MARKWGKYPVWAGVRISEEQDTELRRRAAFTGKPAAVLIREAIELMLKFPATRDMGDGWILHEDGSATWIGPALGFTTRVLNHCVVDTGEVAQ